MNQWTRQQRDKGEWVKCPSWETSAFPGVGGRRGEAPPWRLRFDLARSADTVAGEGRSERLRRFRRNCGIFTRAPEGRSEFCPGLGRAEAKSKSTGAKTRKKGDRHRKSEGRSIRIAPGSRQKGGARAGAGSRSTEARSHLGTWRRLLAPLERPACRSIQLSLPSSPARGREEGAITSHHQVLRAAQILAQAHACGADTQGCTANRSSGGAGKGSSPAFPLMFILLSAFQV